MSEFPVLNKFDKEKKVIELHKEGKTIRAIAPIVHLSFTPISKIIKTYDKKIESETKKRENNSSGQTQKPSISSLAFKLFTDGKKLTDVAIQLEIPAKKAVKLWSQFLRLEGMYECYEFYQVCQNDLPSLLSINNFMKRNDVYGKDIVNVLRQAKDIANLNLYYSSLKTKVEELKQIMSGYSLRPLPPTTNWNHPIDSRYWYFR